MQKAVVPPRGTFYRSHKRRVKALTEISIGRLITGMIVEIRYKAEYRPKHKTSLYLVLDPKWKKKIHCVDLDWIHPRVMVKWVGKSIEHIPATVKIGGEEWSILNFKNRGRALYESIKPILGEDYRTLNIDKQKIASTRIVNYDFGAFITVPDRKKIEKEGLKKLSVKQVKDVPRQKID